MREIKFRVWDKDSKKIYYQDDFILTFDKVGEDVYLSKNNEVTPLYRYELMQYTGLKDKNGKEIYEGDILDYGESGKYKVVFSKSTFKIQKVNNSKGDLYLLEDCWFDESEVIGNIYENPELLK